MADRGREQRAAADAGARTTVLHGDEYGGPPRFGQVVFDDLSPELQALFGATGGSLTVEEVDGSPSGAVTKIKFPNGTLSIAAGVATFTPAGGGSGTVTTFSVVNPAAGVTGAVANATTTPQLTLALADDLAALEGLASTGFAKRINTSVWSTVNNIAASDFAAQSANVVLAGPASGGSAAPTFRALVPADYAGSGTADRILRVDRNTGLQTWVLPNKLFSRAYFLCNLNTVPGCVDQSMHRRAITQPLTISTAVSKFNGSSGAFSGSVRMELTAHPDLVLNTAGNVDFLFRVWLYLSSVSTVQSIMSVRDTISGKGWEYLQDSSGITYLQGDSFNSVVGGTTTFAAGSLSTTANTWQLHEYGRINGEQFIRLNGAVSLTNNGNAQNTAAVSASTPFAFGARTNNTLPVAAGSYAQDLQLYVASSGGPSAAITPPTEYVQDFG